jgi:hypothetical protein
MTGDMPMVAAQINRNLFIIQRFMKLSTTGDNCVDNLEGLPMIPIFSPSDTIDRGPSGYLPG